MTNLTGPRSRVSDYRASKFMTAHVWEARRQTGHLPGGKDGVGVAVGCGFDTDKEVIWVDWRRHRLGGCELIGRIVAGEQLGTHLGWEGSGCHLVDWAYGFARQYKLLYSFEEKEGWI